jgi:hypothetical protein
VMSMCERLGELGDVEFELRRGGRREGKGG